VRDGEKGPVAIEMVTRRVPTRMERKRTGPAAWLVITRRPLTDERTLEARASRDATDHDARDRYHDYLTPAHGAAVPCQEPFLLVLSGQEIYNELAIISCIGNISL
jgi:hypothetical protein